MKDCRFLQPFEKEIQALFPDHEVKWVRDNSNTEYEEIRIDNQMVMNTDVGEFKVPGGNSDFHHSIIVYFPFVVQSYEEYGLHIDDPYHNIINPVRFEAFCDHKCLREIFPFLMCDNRDAIFKKMQNICKMDEMRKDF